jgi:hypothetical protein
MVDSGLFCISMIVVLILVQIMAYIITSRPKKGCELHNADLNQLVPQIVQIMHHYRWKTKVTKNNRKIYVKKDNLVVTNIFLKPKPDGKIDVRYNVSTSIFRWLLTLSMFQQFGHLVIKSHYDSENFATREVIPLIYYHASGTGQLQHSPQTYPCPKCKQSLIFEDNKKRWYCNICMRYYR